VSVDDPETRLRMELMTVQIDKAKFDMRLDGRKYWLQVIGIGVSIVGLVIAAFAAGHFIR
jgi:hypothetical protein